MTKTSNAVLARERMTEKDFRKQEADAFLRDNLDQWLDDMTRRLFLTIEKQLAEIEAAEQPYIEVRDAQTRGANGAHPSRDTFERALTDRLNEETARAGLRERNARSLASLERTLGRLTTLQERRAQNRAAQEDRYAEAKQRMARIIARYAAAGGAAAADRGDDR